MIEMRARTTELAGITSPRTVAENEHPTDVLLYVDAVWQYSKGRLPDFRHESRGAGSNEIEAR